MGILLPNELRTYRFEAGHSGKLGEYRNPLILNRAIFNIFGISLVILLLITFSAILITFCANFIKEYKRISKTQTKGMVYDPSFKHWTPMVVNLIE
jgi:uncharacterized BrkB/YihY/UPF0761 family membrane protein